MIQLYIADKRVDLDDSSFILFNYAYDDLSNPTIVKNSFTKQITLKATPNNNAIFGNLFRSDRKTVFGSGHTGVNYDPLRKNPFTIYGEMGEILETGYVKVDSMTAEEYKITLYGGLGSFLYGLTYDAEGNKRTLYGLTWKFKNGEEKKMNSFAITQYVLKEAWEYLKDGSWSASWYSILNFAPAYNGLPSDFDAGKVLFNSSDYFPFSSANMQKTDSGVTYYKKTGATSVLATLEGNHTEWEMRSIISFLQRPVVKMSAIVDAIAIEAREQGISLKLDETFFREDNPFYGNAWVTLPLVQKEKRQSEDVVDAILKSSLTPCDYLLMIVKMCGLSLTYEKDVIEIRSRNSFFADTQLIDLSERVDVTTIGITPLLSDSKWYRLGGDKVVGEMAAVYKEATGKEYGAQYVNTGYEFNSEVSPLTKDITMTGAPDVAEVRLANAYYGLGVNVSGQALSPVNVYEEVKVQLFPNGSGEGKEFNVPKTMPNVRIQWGATPYMDWFPKAQFHSAEDKAEGGENCILLYDGIKTSSASTPTYYIAGWYPDFDVLNNGTPCWVLDKTNCTLLKDLPSFRRLNGSYSAEWGIPTETYTDEPMDGVLSLYDRYWKAYLTDRYDVDARMMTCKVNLSGIVVGQALLGRFFYYDNAVWVLNKVSNHSITTDDLTECEFVKVKDMDNYKNGQIL
jgi:hypothetical protein